MKRLSDLAQMEGVETLQSEYDDREVRSGYTSDLLSDVMANAQDGCVLLTIQAHPNAVSVAALAGAAGLLVCNNRPVPDDMLEAARKNRLAVFRTPLNQFEASCRVGRLLGA